MTHPGAITLLNLALRDYVGCGRLAIRPIDVPNLVISHLPDSGRATASVAATSKMAPKAFMLAS